MHTVWRLFTKPTHTIDGGCKGQNANPGFKNKTVGLNLQSTWSTLI